MLKLKSETAAHLTALATILIWGILDSVLEQVASIEELEKNGGARE